jgi:hypothetical protein
MTKKPIEPKAGPVSAETKPQSNVERLRTHLNADSLALKMLDAWTSADPHDAKAQLLKAVEDHFNEKKHDDDSPGPKD